MAETLHLQFGRQSAQIRVQPYLVAAAAALTLAYTIMGWDDPTLGLHKSRISHNEFGLAIAVVVVNSLVALLALSNVGALADISAGSNEGFGITVALSLTTALVLAAAGTSIANATVMREKRGDALGISAVVLSGLSVLPTLMIMLVGAKRLVMGR